MINLGHYVRYDPCSAIPLLPKILEQVGWSLAFAKIFLKNKFCVDDVDLKMCSSSNGPMNWLQYLQIGMFLLLKSTSTS